MSAQNVGAVRRAWEAFNRGDLETFLADAAADVEFEEDPAFPEAAVFRGREEILTYLKSFHEAMADHHFEVEELRDLGDRVLALLHETARGTSSGVGVDQRPAFLYEFRDGLIVRVRAYLDRAEGLAAVGGG
ncbi:MAG TPA: nuclear transport factor 2 family protein [Solirubrobacteraceae bacterium]|nr:nuclear transport factor 2 family protein [Solirubrobacteraceae bacterium]